MSKLIIKQAIIQPLPNIYIEPKKRGFFVKWSRIIHMGWVMGAKVGT